MAGPKKKPVLPSIPPKAKVVKGNLVAKKDLTFEGVTYVQGDVLVAGVLQERRHTDMLIATGSIKAKGIKSGGTIYAGKTVEAEVIFVELEGKVGAVSGIKATLSILEDADCEIEGKNNAKTRIVLSTASTGPLKKLKKYLAPDAFLLAEGETEIDDDSIFDYSNLMGTISRGKPWDASKAPKTASKKAKATTKPTPKPAPKKKEDMLNWSRYLEFKGGSSSKFWEVTVARAGVHGILTTRYGKIGTPGQTTVKKFDVPFYATTEGEKLLKEKKRKGYKEKR